MTFNRYKNKFFILNLKTLTIKYCQTLSSLWKRIRGRQDQVRTTGSQSYGLVINFSYLPVMFHIAYIHEVSTNLT